MINYVYVALGGGVGATLRYAISVALLNLIPTFPAGTVVVNLLGSFLMGFLVPFFSDLGVMKPFILVGFLGGFTTFSSFSLDFLELVDSQRYSIAFIYWVIGSVLCLLFTLLGLKLNMLITSS